MKRLLMLMLLLVATPAWATTSYYHIPASALRPVRNNSGVCCGLPTCQGECSSCTANTEDGMITWRCAGTEGLDQGVETDVFSLPGFALSTSIFVRVIFRENCTGGNCAGRAVGFYGWFEVTPLPSPGGDWTQNAGQQCAPSATGTNPLPTHGNVDNAANVTIATCNQATGETCSNVPACVGPTATGYHGVLVIRRDMSSFSPQILFPVDITELIVGVTTP